MQEHVGRPQELLYIVEAWIVLSQRNVNLDLKKKIEVDYVRHPHQPTLHLPGLRRGHRQTRSSDPSFFS